MSILPNNLKYTKSHEWFKIDGDIATVGITDFAQHQLTDIVYVDMPVRELTIVEVFHCNAQEVLP